jgi:anti-sigma B factor antagonist
MKTNVTEKYGCVILELKGNVMGGPKSEDFSNLLHSLINDGKLNVVVDLGKVKFMNSSGLGLLIGGLTTMKKAGGDLRICRADNKIESLLVVTKLITVFKHFKSVDEAVQSFEQ